MSTEVNQGLSLSTNPQTVRNKLQEHFLNTLVTRGKPFISNRNQRRCLKWGRDHSAWTINDRKHVRWTDDIKFKSFGKFDSIPSKPENSGRLLFSRKLGALKSAKMVTMWFQDRKVKILPWAVQSPDLSPKEHLWSEVEHKITNRSPSSKENLKTIIAAAWEDIAPDFTKNCWNPCPNEFKEPPQGKEGDRCTTADQCLDPPQKAGQPKLYKHCAAENFYYFKASYGFCLYSTDSKTRVDFLYVGKGTCVHKSWGCQVDADCCRGLTCALETSVYNHVGYRCGGDYDETYANGLTYYKNNFKNKTSKPK
ncbi:Transposable element Tcb1 transposase [Folsomia candida]|uniref:Transposable element Tcb1 transposase n=1 Tax=Folsomia candida TaxID=158441 RepID=A0A226DMF2_FOLCA|nr:Transposable element Tcb1 transposase [Folsomia candida]